MKLNLFMFLSIVPFLVHLSLTSLLYQLAHASQFLVRTCLAVIKWFCNPSYMEGWDQDCDSKLPQAKNKTKQNKVCEIPSRKKWWFVPLIQTPEGSIKEENHNPGWCGQRTWSYLQNNNSKKDRRHGWSGTVPA
jgi:hypothetical protein